MKITKRQLRKIIKEEKARLLSELTPGELGMAAAGGGTPADQGLAAVRADFARSEEDDDEAYMEAMLDLYADLSAALAKAKKAGIDYNDLQTAFDDASAENGY